MSYYVSPKVYLLLDSKSDEELYRIYNHLVELQHRLLLNGDLRCNYINRHLIHEIDDMLYYRYLDLLELSNLASEYAEDCYACSGC